MGKMSRDCDKDITNGKSWSSRRSPRVFAGPNRASIDTKKEDYVELPTDSFIGQGRTYDFL